MTRLLLAINGCAAAVTAALVLWLSSASGLDLFVLLIVAWAVLPYLLLALTPAMARRFAVAAGPGPALAGSALMAGLAGVTLVSAFFLDPDPQSPLVLLTLPVLQLGGVVIAFAITVLTARRRAA